MSLLAELIFLLAEYCYNCFLVVWAPICWVFNAGWMLLSNSLVLVIVIILVEIIAYCALWDRIPRGGWKIIEHTPSWLIKEFDKKRQITGIILKTILTVMHFGFYLTLWKRYQSGIPESDTGTAIVLGGICLAVTFALIMNPTSNSSTCRSS